MDFLHIVDNSQHPHQGKADKLGQLPSIIIILMLYLFITTTEKDQRCVKITKQLINNNHLQIQVIVHKQLIDGMREINVIVFYA